MLPKRLQTTLHKKNVPLNFSGLCNLGRMQCCSEAPINIAQKKIQTVQAMLFEQHLVTVFIHVYIRSFTSRKNIKLCLLYYENELKLTLKQQLGILPSNRSNFQWDIISKSKTFSQPCNVAETHAILSHSFCKVSGPRFHKLLTLNEVVHQINSLLEVLELRQNF